VRSELPPVCATLRVALVGNPNSGKTTLFNALTGLHHKVGNYPGVTVERKEGRISTGPRTQADLIDLPGTYSLHAGSPDEQIATDVLLGNADHTGPPELVLCAVDATNIERSLYLVTQIIDRHLPLVVALTKMDSAAHNGLSIDTQKLQEALGVPIVPVVAQNGSGLDQLRSALSMDGRSEDRLPSWTLPEPLQRACDRLVFLLHQELRRSRPAATHEAFALLATPDVHQIDFTRYSPAVAREIRKVHERLTFLGIDRQSAFVEARYAWIKELCAGAVHGPDQPRPRLTDRIDHIVTHRVWGFLIFLAIMGLMFQSIFSWAVIPMAWIAEGFTRLGTLLTRTMPPGDLRDLLVDGAIGGVASVVTFLPQIVFLFLFLGLLEDSGYMARAAFIMDRIMGKVGLHGKSFIPLLGSFACAIPGIMATRTIENPKDRLATILVAPLMSCSARLPVYSLLIAAFVPPLALFGILSLQGMVLLSLYLFGMTTALLMAWLFKKTLLRGTPPLFIMELPPYRMPSFKAVLYQVWERALAFLKTAGTIILGVSILLWFLASYPKSEGAMRAQQLEQSYAGQAGKTIEPLIRPLGFDWKIGIGLVSSLMQREAFVSAMGTIYNMQADGNTPAKGSLGEAMRNDRDPVTGQPTFTLLTALSLLAYYVLAMQCLSTVAVVRRETNSWRWPLLQIAYMSILAYGCTFMVYRVGLTLGWGG
jgi:ferrous iron transport protein B